MKHIDPSEINIINYLTGEMTNEELKQFELQLDENQLLRAQVEEMKITQSNLEVWKNEDIDIPNFKPLDTRNQNLQSKGESQSKKIHLPNWMKYAAAFLGFVMLMQVSGFKVNHDGNTLLLSFGEPKTESLNVNNVDEIVANAIDKFAKAQNSQLVEFKNQMNADLNNITSAVNNITVKNQLNQAQLETMFSRNMDNQYVSLESMIKGIEDNQRQELEDSFTGFVEYIDNKRINDQYKIQNAFSEIATAINNQQYQTNALLTSISDEDPGLKSY